MTARRILRAMTRPVRRLLRPLRLRLIAHRIARSEQQIDRLREMREDLVLMEKYEHQQQIHLCVRRIELERGC